MNDIHSVIRSIRGKDSLQENLEKYGSIVKADAGRLAHAELALKLLSLYESALEDESPDAHTLACMDLVRSFISGEAHLPEVIAFRKENTARMETVTRTADLYELLEYLLNRAEHRFEGERTLPSSYSDMQFTEEIMSYFAGMKDEARGIAVSEVLEQLPVRMTKNRFAELVAARLGIYRASDDQAFRDITDAVRSAAGLCTPDASYEPAAALAEVKAVFAGKKLSELTEEEYFSMKEKLAEAASKIAYDSERLKETAGVLNSLEAMALSMPLQDFPESECAGQIIEKTLEMAARLPEGDEALLAETMELCGGIEGHFEDAAEEFRTDSAFLEDLRNRYEEELTEADLTADYDALGMIADLHSDSLFAPEKEDRITASALEEEAFEEGVRTLVEALLSVFSESSRSYARGIMAKVFAVLPPVFKTSEALENYIFASLSSCSDTEEKLGCIELIGKIMEQ